MKDRRIQDKKEVQKCSRSYLNDSSPLTESSRINEEFYRIKAIEQGGLPIEILDVVPEVSYRPTFALKPPDGFVKISSSSKEENNEVTREFLNLDTRHPVIYYCTSFFVDFDIYYNTAFGQTYKACFNQSRSNPSYRNKNAERILKSIMQEVDSSNQLDTISDIGSSNTIDAILRPDESLKDGKIELDGRKSSFSKCKKADYSRATSNNSDAVTYFALGDNYETFGSSRGIMPSDWIWSYISDVRENGDIIVLTVDTPIGKAVFPYNLNHDTEAPFWTLVDEAGGQLTSLRGMDVCIRTRSGYQEVYKKYTIGKNGFKCNEYPEYNEKTTNQPINTPNKDGNPSVIDCDVTDVNPVGVDEKSAWTLGIPPHNRFERDRTSKEVKPDKEPPSSNNILNKITNIIR